MIKSLIILSFLFPVLEQVDLSSVFQYGETFLSLLSQVKLQSVTTDIISTAKLLGTAVPVVVGVYGFSKAAYDIVSEKGDGVTSIITAIVGTGVAALVKSVG